MKLREDVQEHGRTRKAKYDFSGVRPGSSAWVATQAERVRLLSAFKYWVKNNRDMRVRANAYAVSEKVGQSDPDGTGFRVFFKTREAPVQRHDDGDAI